MKPVLINHNRLLGADARAPLWPRSAVRIGFGLIWLVDAVFKWLPDFHKGIVGMVQGAATGQPSWLHGWFHFWINAVQAHPSFWAYGIAMLETAVALAIILGFARKLTYGVTIVTALFIWGIAEGFGGPYSGTSTDIGAAVMYAVVALAMLILSLQLGPDRYSVDYWLEQRVSWWHQVAELGAHNHPVSRHSGAAPLAKPVVGLATTAPDTPVDTNGSVPLDPPVIPVGTAVASHHPGLAQAKMREVGTELMHRRHLPISEQRRWLGTVLRGHYNYVTLPTTVAGENGVAPLTTPAVMVAITAPDIVEGANGSGKPAPPVVSVTITAPDIAEGERSDTVAPPLVPVAS